MNFVNNHRLKGGGFGLRLKAGSVRRSADSGHAKIIVGLGGLLGLDVFGPDFIGHVAAAGHPIAPRPQMLAPVSLAEARKLAQQLVRAGGPSGTAPPARPTGSAASIAAGGRDRD